MTTSSTQASSQSQTFEIRTRGPAPARQPWVDWVQTTDHKRVGILFISAALVFFILGGAEALLMRIQLGTPDNTFLSAERYNQLFSLHGTTMIFLFMLPILVGLASYVIPLAIGARGLAFPRLQALSFWLLVAGGTVLYGSLLFEAPAAGWTSFPPLSGDTYLPGGGMDAWVVGLLLVVLALVSSAINLMVTIHNMRAPGMAWRRLPLFAWAVLVYSYVVILTAPVIAAALTMLLTDRHFGTHFFDPAGGGNALLWQYLFWFFSHPAIYVLTLPALGIVSEIIPVFSRRRIFSRTGMMSATVLIALFGLVSYGIHLVRDPVGAWSKIFFMVAFLLLGVPAAVKLFNWIGTLWRGTIRYQVPMLFALGAVGMLVIGVLSGIFLALVPLNWQVGLSYFSVAHLHYILLGGAGFAIFAGIHYWFPKMTGRLANEGPAELSFWLMLIGFNVTFIVQFSLGLSGMPNRINEYPDLSALGWNVDNLISTTGAFVLALGVVIAVVNLLRSTRAGRRSGSDPWRADTLEWFTSSPPPANNFDAILTIKGPVPMQDIRRQVAEQSGAASEI